MYYRQVSNWTYWLWGTSFFAASCGGLRLGLDVKEYLARIDFRFDTIERQSNFSDLSYANHKNRFGIAAVI